MSEIRKKTIEGLKTGDTFIVSRKFTKQDTMRFADITRDYNPIHFEERFIKLKKLRGQICHGLLVGSMITEIGGQIGWLATTLDFRFKRPVYFGDTITCRLTITDIDDRGWAKAEAIYKNQDDDIVSEAFITGFIPSAQEQKVLKAMVAEGDPTNKLR